MNSTWLVGLLIQLVGFYLALGFLAALWLIFAGLGRLDPVAREGSIGFKLLVLPGLCLFWPVFLVRILQRRDKPPEEHNAHRREPQS